MSTSNKNSKSFTFRTPAGIQDFNGNPQKQAALNALWNANLNGFTEQGMLGNPWNATNAPVPTNYYNPIQENPTPLYGFVRWSAFPGRLAYNYPSATQAQLNQMADTGQMIGQINDSPCTPSTGSNAPYYPYGPRGWQDEYCEWAVTRNENGDITRIDFTCENPEYWNSLWLIDPSMVLQLYQSILNKPQIKLEDLSLPGVVDPITGAPIYNPLNKWNSGTVSSRTQGGAIHLTSTPNTLQTEIGLATAASVQRTNGSPDDTFWPSTQYNNLLCDAQFGQKFRNSDPNIGGTVNSLVNSNGNAPGSSGLVASLANPPGLYIQMPDFTTYVTPDGTPASNFWNITRGSLTLYDENGVQLPNNFILHAVFEVPSDLGYTVSQIQIGGVNIEYGSQVADTFLMQIVAMGFAGTVPQGYPPVGSPSPANTFAQPLQLFYEDYFTAMYKTLVPNPVNNPISLLSNSTFIPPTVFQSATAVKMVLTCGTCTAVPGDESTYPTVHFDDPAINAVVTKVDNTINYAVPGNSLPSGSTALYLLVDVGPTAAAGRHSVYVTNKGQAQSVPMPALLQVSPVIIQSTVSWQNTGVIVEPGVAVNIAYVKGMWTANPQDNDGELYDASGVPSFIVAPEGYAMPGQNEGALVGRVGGTVFMVGMGCTVPNNLSGPLELVINDDLNGIYGAGLTDNIGNIQVSITYL